MLSPIPLIKNRYIPCAMRSKRYHFPRRGREQNIHPLLAEYRQTLAHTRFLKFRIVRPRTLLSRSGKTRDYIGTLSLWLLKAASPLLSGEGLICSNPEENVGRAHAIGRKLLRARKATRITKREDNLKCTLACMVAGY